MKIPWYFSGHSTASISSCFTSPKPPTSSHFMSGTSTKTSLIAEGSISFMTSTKSSMVTIILLIMSPGTLSADRSISGRTRLNPRIAASFANAWRSAPTNPWEISASISRLTSLASGIPLVCICSTSNLPSLSGTPISISLSNLPGRRRAGSTAFSRLVAPMTTTFPLDVSPSISDNSWATTRLSTSPETSSLFGAIESSSSMKIIAGAFFSAS